MSHEIRRKDRALPEAEAYAILAEGGDGVLATWGEDGYPYAVPMNHVLADGVLYLHCAQTGHRMDNLAHCDKVSYCVVAAREVVPAQLSTNYRSAVVFGQATRVEDPEEKRRGLMALLHRFAPGHLEAGVKALEHDLARTAVLRIDIHRVTGKARKQTA
ncbi:MAG: pyridoxamine 5'-phosphate oxidase family protein [Holophaga sp.]|nr:pyridoxamine 5'-phosphate oxidase family protein [Holophaga sp.]